MVNYDQAKKLITQSFKDSKITSAMRLPDGYLFSLKPKSWGDDEYVLDGFFKVSSQDGKISEYSPVMDPAEFKEAMKNEIE